MSGLTQLAGSTSGVAYLAEVNASGKLQVVDSAVSACISASKVAVVDSAVATALGGTLNVAGTFYQATQPVSLASTVAVSGTFFQATQPVSIAGTVSVSAPAISATSAVQKSAVSVANGATETTTALDLDTVRRVAVFGNLNDTTGQIKVKVSRDDTTYYTNEEVVIFINASGDFYKTIELDARYVEFEYTNGSGSTKVLTLNTSFKA